MKQNINLLKKRISLLAGGDKVEIIQEIPMEEATMYIIECGDWMNVSVIVNDDGTLFQQKDWQSGNPSTKEEIEDFDWLTEDGRDAIVLSGQPRVMY